MLNQKLVKNWGSSIRHARSERGRGGPAKSVFAPMRGRVKVLL